ncbi:hypothetical protein FIBSPDRAFT_876628 [Athelia psychrophila]|uniref:Uncharacterized protein n=1 Tax=Athelia psychrophila TaxID=1759441 RepID=A0A167WPD1_9AGAM|nr:hypothetical protein FIBSPDRAFT_876628 [Fibularhizoctonia sp. CBS 109695]
MPYPSITSVLDPTPLVLDPSLTRPVSPSTSSISTMRFAPSPFYEPSWISASLASDGEDDEEEDSASFWALANLKSPLPSITSYGTMSSLAPSKRPLSFSDLGCESDEDGTCKGDGEKVPFETPPLQEQYSGKAEPIHEEDEDICMPLSPISVSSVGAEPELVGMPRRSESEICELEKASKNATAIYRYRCVSEDEPIVCHICQNEAEAVGIMRAKRSHHQLRNAQALALHLRLHDLDIDPASAPSLAPPLACPAPSKRASCLNINYRRLLCCASGNNLEDM